MSHLCPQDCVCVVGRPVRPGTLHSRASVPRTLNLSCFVASLLRAPLRAQRTEGQLRATQATATDDQALLVPPPTSGLRV